MSHLTELQFSMLADGALDSEELARVQAHISACDQCNAQVGVYEDDIRLVRAAFSVEEEVAIAAPPKFKKPLGFREFAMANLLTGALFWFAQFSWKTVFGELVMDGLSWLTSLVVPDAYDIVVSTVLYLTLEGTAMFEAYSEFIVSGLIGIGILGLALSIRRSTAAMSLSVLMAFMAVAVPQDAQAFEHKKGDLVIGAGETINDTLLFTGESLSVDGDINGDLVAFGRRVVINGKVDGNLIVAAKSITVSGEVTGTVWNAGETIDLAGIIVGRDFWGAGESVRVNQDSRIGGNAILAGELASVAGTVGRDLMAAGETVEVSGEVGEDIVAAAESLKLLGEAVVNGDVTIHTIDEDALQQSGGAIIKGNVIYEHKDFEGKSRNEYLTAGYYLRQVLRLIAAFIVGYGLFVLVPRMQQVKLESGATGIATGGLGLVGLVSGPIIAVILAITVVGLPLAFFGIFAWIVAVYIAKILVAWMIGKMLVDESDEGRGVAITLAVGLVIVIVAVNLPFVGGFVGLVLTVVGFGMLIRWIRSNMQAI